MAAVVEQPLPKLYVYDSCPFCVRARAIFGLKGIDHELVFVAFHDVATPVGLVGLKQTPILQLPSGKAFAESGDIIKYVDEHYGDAVLLQEASGREDLAAWTKAAMMDFMQLIFPRGEHTPFPEYAQKKSRVYFREGKEKIFGSFDAMRAKTPELLEKANAHLVALDKLVFSDRLVNESGISYDDIAIFATLRGLTLIKGLEWPTKLRAYVDYYAEATDIPLLDAMAQ